MKKTQWKDAIRNIGKRLVSYLSIVLVVTLGLGGMFATRYMEAGIKKEASGYYDEHNFKNYEFLSSYGISEANLERIRKDGNVTDAEGVIQADGSVYYDGKKKNVTIISLTERVSTPGVTEGRLPEGKDECLIGEDFAEMEGIRTGDRVKLSLTGLSSVKDQLAGSMDMEISTDGSEEGSAGDSASEDGKNGSPLLCSEFTVTGLMHHPDYLRRKSVNTVVLPLSAFDTEVTEGLYTRAFVRISQPEKVNMFEDRYFDETADTQKELEALADELADERLKEVRDEANRYIDDEWAKAEAKLADAQAQIDSGEAELNSKLAEGRNKLNSAENKLAKETARYNKLFRKGEMTIAEYEKKIADARRLIAEARAELDRKKKELEEGKAGIDALKKRFGGDEAIKAMYDAAKKAEDEIAEIDALIKEQGETPAAQIMIRALGRQILDDQAAFKAAFDAAQDPQLMSSLESLKQQYPDVDFSKAISAVQAMQGYSFDEFIADVQQMADSGDLTVYYRIRELILKAADAVRSLIEQLWAAEAKIADGERQIADAEAQIAAAEKMVADGEAQLAAKKKELRDGKKKFAKEKEKAGEKIKAGWAEYYAEKARYEEKLAEAIELLGENRAKAEEKLAEARAEADNIAPCDWIVLDRKSNAGYIDMKSNIDAIRDVGIVFGVLFTIITAIVCFSTLVIIIDEQKTLVGTSKAFGFYRREVLAKYLVFGVSAALVGALLAVGAAMILSGILQKSFTVTGMYPIKQAKSIITVGPTVLFSLLIAAVTVAATVVACLDILRSPASFLMKGSVLRKEKKNRKKEKKEVSKTGGSLYSRLIIRNMIQDKARVLVTISVIAFSCMLTGMGISMKYAFDGMMNRQSRVVNRYDILMSMNADVTEEDEAALVSVLESSNTGFMPATMMSTLYRWNGRLDAVSLICANPERIDEFYGITDIKGSDIPLPEDGILIQKRMNESYGMEVGDDLPVLDSKLRSHDAKIAGIFVNYAGRAIVMSPAAYKDVFGEANTANCYFIRLNGADPDRLTAELLGVSDNISFSYNGDFRSKFESVSKLYDLLVLIITGISILISFMILTNLANIYLTRKKTELTVMRVNGFTVRECRGYLSKESLYTTVIGLAVGVLAGAVLTPLIIKAVQQPDLEFDKSFHITAWAAAVIMEALFAALINSFVYRKIKDLRLRDIA